MARGVFALAAGALGALVVLGMGRAAADPTQTGGAAPIRIEYDADLTCPGREAFAGEVLARTSRARLAAPGETARAFRISIKKRDRVVIGRLEVDGGGVRELDGATCAEVVSALALIAALTIDPEASTAPLPAGSAPPASAPGADAGTAPPPETTAASPTPPTVPAAPSPSPIAPPPAPLPIDRPAREQTGLTWTAGAALTLAGEAAPRTLIGGAAALDVRSRRPWGFAARLGFAYETTGPFDAGPGGALFTRATGRLDGCPLSVPLADALWLVPCAGLAAGMLRAQGLARGRIVVGKEVVLPWVEAGTGARIALEVEDLVVFEAGGGLGVPITRQTFVFEQPDSQVHEMPPHHLERRDRRRGAFVVIDRPGSGHKPTMIEASEPGGVSSSPARSRVSSESAAALLVTAPPADDAQGAASRSSGQEAARRADPARAKALVTTHFDFVWRSLLRLGVPRADAEDALQQVFIVATSKIDRIEEGAEKAFLFGTALRVASRSHRTRVRRREVAADDADERPDLALAADEQLDRARARALLDEMLDRMPLDLRAVFVLYELEQLTVPEIANIVGVPLGTAASRLRRAREEFRAQLKRLEAARKLPRSQP